MYGLNSINHAIIPDSYPLPIIKELSYQLAGSTVFSKIDLRWGYLQCSLSKDNSYLTAVITHEGVLRFIGLCFGICSGPSTFQKIIHGISAGLDGCVNLLDEILVHEKSRMEHDQSLKAQLCRQQYNAY